MIQKVMDGQQNERMHLYSRIGVLESKVQNLENQLTDKMNLLDYFDGGPVDTQEILHTLQAEQPSHLISENTIKLDLKEED